jgi:hypothetical protein
VLDGRRLLEIACVDRVYLTLSVPSLVVGGQVVSFLTAHEGNPDPLTSQAPDEKAHPRSPRRILPG